MLLVDTTVWIDFFRGDSSPHVGRLVHALARGDDVCICGVVLTEILQGIREDRDHRRVLSRLDPLLFLPMTRQTFVDAAGIYRTLRRKGVTIRRATDCLIAAVAIEHDVELLHHDRDFDPIRKHCGLKVAVVDRTRRVP